MPILLESAGQSTPPSAILAGYSDVDENHEGVLAGDNLGGFGSTLSSVRSAMVNELKLAKALGSKLEKIRRAIAGARTPAQREKLIALQNKIGPRMATVGNKAALATARYERAKAAHGVLAMADAAAKAGMREEASALRARAKQIAATKVAVPLPAKATAQRASQAVQNGGLVSRMAAQAGISHDFQAVVRQAQATGAAAGGVPGASVLTKRTVPVGATAFRKQVNAQAQAIVQGSQGLNGFEDPAQAASLSAYGLGDLGELGELGDWPSWDDVKAIAGKAAAVIKQVVPEHTIVGKAFKGDFKGAAKSTADLVKSKKPAAKPTPPPAQQQKLEQATQAAMAQFAKNENAAVQRAVGAGPSKAVIAAGAAGLGIAAFFFLR